MHSICFIANYSKTYFFHEIAQNLIAQNIQVNWIVVNQKLNEFLVQEYGTDAVLYLNREFIKKESPAIGTFKINELIYGDRVLKNEAQNGRQFLTNIQQPIYDFLKNNNIQKVFGEITWAHELLVHRICTSLEELACQYLNPHVVRLPNERFAFFTDERQSQLLEFEAAPAEAPVIEVKKPSYLKINDGILKKANSISGRFDKIKRWVTNENIDKNDPTLITDGKTRLQTRTKEEWNKEIYRLVNRVELERVNEKPYVFVGLHKQPESSVDVLGRYYEDQLINIMNLWRALPPNWNMLIKEHTNAIGDRGLIFYQRLQALPNVYFVNEKTDSYQLIKGAALVATITGTIAYEAALMGIPSVTFAPTFFNRINSCEQIGLSDLGLCDSLAEIADNLRQQKDNRKIFSGYLLANSFEGILSDPISNSAILEAANLEKVSIAFCQAVKWSGTTSVNKTVGAIPNFSIH